MSAFDRFKEFFEREGVQHETYTTYNPTGELGDILIDRDGLRHYVAYAISVAQAVFYFSANKEYVGVLWDEMGYFDVKVADTRKEV